MNLSTVILASFNYARWLEEAIRSVWSQADAAVELIVTDDGSTDESVSRARALVAASPIPMKVIAHANVGMPASLNIALREARGQFIQLLAADDRFSADKTRLQLEALEASPRSVICHSRYRPIDADGRELSTKAAAQWESVEFNAAVGDCFEDLVLGRSAVRTGLMIRRSFLDELGGFDESYRAEDWPLILRAAHRGPVAFIDAPLIDRRLHGNNWTFRFLRQLPGDESARNAGLHLFRELAPRPLATEATWRTLTLCVTTAVNGNRPDWALAFARATLKLYPELYSRVPALFARMAASFGWNRVGRRVLPEAAANWLAHHARRHL